MKIESLAILLICTALTRSATTPSPPSTPPSTPPSGKSDKDKKEVPKEPIQCKRNLLKSYMLKGVQSATDKPMYICPSVTANCCAKKDQQKIYHIVNNIVPGRILEYQSKMKMALAKLKALHNRILDNQPNFSGSSKRREFCNKEARKVYNFPFNFFYNRALELLDESRTEMNDFYEKFFCILCDGKTHKFFNLKGKSSNVMMKGEFCKETLKSHQEIIKVFSVELVEYMISLQNMVDCTHYIKSYNLKFFDEHKQKMMTEVSECLSNVDSETFMKSCSNTCSELKMSKMSSLIEGDFEFLIDGVNLFEKFFELKESGNLVSMKLRKFFQKFVIPRRMKQEQQSLFITKVNKDIDNIAKQSRILSNESQDQNKPKEEQPLAQELQQGRLLAETPQAATNSTQNQTLSGNTTNGTNETNSTDSSMPPYKRTAKLVYNRDLFHFYDEITIQEPTTGSLIFRINQRPVDIDKLPKVFALGVGINPLDYSTKFTLPQDVFYRLLFSYRKPDVPDAAMMYFLIDFNQKNLDAYNSDLTTVFKIPPKLDPQEKNNSQKTKKKKRLLAEIISMKAFMSQPSKNSGPL